MTDHLQDFQNEEQINIKEILFKYLRYWKVFLITIPLGIGIAYLLNHFTPPVYQISAKILLQEEKQLFDPESIIGGSLFGNDPGYKIQNEIGIITSKALTKKALKPLDLKVSYYYEANFIQQDLYPVKPFLVIPDTMHPQIVNTVFNLNFFGPDSFELYTECDNIVTHNFKENTSEFVREPLRFHTRAAFSDTIVTPYFRFIVYLNTTEPLNEAEGNYSFRFNSLSMLVNKFRNFEVAQIPSSTILRISTLNQNVKLAVDFLNSLTNAYLQKGIERKNLIATNTIQFIDNQLTDITDSLTVSENSLQEFRSSRSLMNMDFQAQQTLQKLEDIQNEKAEQAIQLRYFEYLDNFLRTQDGGEALVAPSAMDVNDPLMQSLLMELTAMYSERSELEINSIKDHPVITSLNKRIEDKKEAVLESLSNIIESKKLNIAETDKRINTIANNVSKLPQTERELFSIERKFKLNDALYTYLITKRSEMQISKASNLPVNEVIQPAEAIDYVLTAPKPRTNYAIALVLSFGIPGLIIFLIEFFNDRITSNKQIEKTTSNLILGHIIHSNKHESTAVLSHPKSLITESFRNIRTNLRFVAKEHEKHTILITSSMMGEGKSFISVNLASAFAMNNKKCILLGFDLRKPTLHNYFNVETEEGLSTFLSENCNRDQIIQKSKHENLDVIISGPEPPNPTELISSKRTKELFDYLKEAYDYIFIDSPPVGLVTDALLLEEFADIKILTVRHNHSRERVFENSIRELERRNIKNVNILINDIRVTANSYGYGHGYEYGYGYGYGYQKT